MLRKAEVLLPELGADEPFSAVTYNSKNFLLKTYNHIMMDLHDI